MTRLLSFIFQIYLIVTQLYFIKHRFGDISVSLSVQTSDALIRDKCITLIASSLWS
jgi:hypothetical protein